MLNPLAVMNDLASDLDTRCRLFKTGELLVQRCLRLLEMIVVMRRVILEISDLSTDTV